MLTISKLLFASLKATYLKFVSILFFVLFLCLQPTGASAQNLPLNDPYREYLQVLTLNGTLTNSQNISPVFNHIRLDPSSLDSLEHPWSRIPGPLFTANDNEKFEFSLYDPEFASYWQSLEPGGTHDGPTWQGRGFTSDLSAGFFTRLGIISASFQPKFVFTQNREFTLSPYENASNKSIYAYPLGNIDWPQRFGNNSFWSFYLGNSYLRADYHGWATGISNEQMRWGPARQNAILLDSNAPGFRHFFIGTSQPKNIYVGYLSTKVFWGKLLESDYFDEEPANNERFISGLRLSITPKPVPGLTLGINRIFYETIPSEGIPVKDLFKVFEAFTKDSFANDSNLGGNDEADQLLSIFGKLTFPESGLEIYAEWARTDHSWDWRDFFTEPEHSRGYTLGLQKVFHLNKGHLLSLNAELTQLEKNKTDAFRAGPTFYEHYKSIQGYTNRGQLLGASVGPGSSSQFLGGSLFFGDGQIKIFTQRVALNNDFLYGSDVMLDPEIQDPTTRKYQLHNTELRFGASLLYFFRRLTGEIGFTYRRELNDDYIYKNDKTHLGIELSLCYRISSLQ